jgi:hypothetical protein
MARKPLAPYSFHDRVLLPELITIDGEVVTMVNKVIGMGFIIEPRLPGLTKLLVTLDDGGEYGEDSPTDRAQLMAFLWKNGWECEVETGVPGIDLVFTFTPKAAG